MIRGWDNKGAMFIGLVRGPLLDRFLAGERVCLPGHGNHPHVCLFLRKDNSELLAATKEYFPGGALPGAKLEHVSTEEPGSSEASSEREKPQGEREWSP